MSIPTFFAQNIGLGVTIDVVVATPRVHLNAVFMSTPVVWLLGPRTEI